MKTGNLGYKHKGEEEESHQRSRNTHPATHTYTEKHLHAATPSWNIKKEPIMIIWPSSSNKNKTALTFANYIQLMTQLNVM